MGRGSIYENIEEMLMTFDKYGLLKDAELLMNCTWKIIYPIFPIVYPRYSKQNADVFMDWRKAIVKSREFDITAQVSAYRKSMAEISP